MMNCDGKLEDDELSSKNLLSVDELKLLFKLNNIQTTFNDNELEQYISITQKSMLAELGITLKPVHHTYNVYPNYTEPRKQTRVPVTLPLVHVKNIDEIKVNNKILVEDIDYEFDEKNSIIFLKPRWHKGFWRWWWYWHWGIAVRVKIKYTTQFDADDLILDLLSSLLGDLLVYNQLPMNQRDVKSIKEGDVTVSWDNDNAHSLPKAINDKKDRLLDLLNSNPRVMMI